MEQALIRETERRVPAAGLELLESLFVVDDLVKLLTARIRGSRSSSGMVSLNHTPGPSP
jgi:hypothetical protein